MWRFLINSSIGFGGILDIARLLELEKQRSSFEINKKLTYNFILILF